MDILIKKQTFVVSGNRATHKHGFDLCAHATTSEMHANESMHMMVEESSDMPVIDDGLSSAGEIEKFLCRKVKILQGTWDVNNFFDANLAVWQVFLDNPAIKNKLQNYFLVKGNLKITVMVNGTPFHAGMLLASYIYFGADENSVFTPAGELQFITRSQRPHLWCNVSTNKGGCICVPFFHPNNYLRLTDLAQTKNIGVLRINSFGLLQQLNGGTDKVTITVFAEMVNPKLTVATNTLQAVSAPAPFPNFMLIAHADEYEDDGPISKPASTVAKIAGALRELPVIGPFATATEGVASTFGSIARAFGFSKPVEVCDVKKVKNVPISNLAITEGSDITQKLTVTAKQEMSIDSRLVGLEGEDELALSNFVHRESYVSNMVWRNVDLPGDVVYALEVDPMIHKSQSGPAGSRHVFPTSLSYATRLFDAWSGSITFRFQAIVSQYHRGRIGVFYNPHGNLGSTDDMYNTTFNTIIDLAEGNDFTITIPFQQGRGYCITNKDETHVYTQQVNAQNFTPDGVSSNGALYFQVINQLVAPDPTVDARFLISVKGGDDFELMNPVGESASAKFFLPVATSAWVPCDDIFSLRAHSERDTGDAEENAPEAVINKIELVPGVRECSDKKPLVFYGERILSLRQLLKRYTYYRTLFTSNGSSVTSAYYRYNFPTFPLSPGFDTEGPDLIAATPYSYVGDTYLSYFKRCFSGWKGSVRYKFCDNTGNGNSMTVQRLETIAARSQSVDFTGILTTLTNSITPTQAAFLVSQNRKDAKAGMGRTQVKQLSVLDAEIPYAMPFRFSPCKLNSHGGFNSYDNFFPGGNAVQFEWQGSKRECNVDVFVSAGEDFNFFGFIGAPTFYVHDDPIP